MHLTYTLYAQGIKYYSRAMLWREHNNSTALITHTQPAVSATSPSHANAKHPSFKVFFELTHHAVKVGFIGPQKLCFHEFEATLMPNTLVSIAFLGSTHHVAKVSLFGPKRNVFISPKPR